MEIRTHLILGDNVLGFCMRNSRIWDCEGLIISKRRLSASWKVIAPPIASFVRLLTSSPLPQNSANSSMPSSLMTVESTSKHTISADWIIRLASKTRLLLLSRADDVFELVVGVVVVILRTIVCICGMTICVIGGIVMELAFDDGTAIATKLASDLWKLKNRVKFMSKRYSDSVSDFIIIAAVVNN